MCEKLKHQFALDQCLEWINSNRYQRVILQFKPEHIKDSTRIVEYIEKSHKSYSDGSGDLDSDASLDLYVTQSNTCCVDMLVTQHVSNVDAIVFFGRACLTKPHLVNQDQQTPVMFSFDHIEQDSAIFKTNLLKITDHIQSLASQNSNCPICVFYDTNLTDYAQGVQNFLQNSILEKSVEVAKLIIPSARWSTTADQSLTIGQPEHCFGQYSFNKPMDHYKSAICLSEKPSIKLTLQMPGNFWMVDCRGEVEIEKVNVSKALNKRMALVNRLRDDEELKFGVIITNPLPNLNECLPTLGKFAKARRHVLYPISMIQTIDECKIGNFDLCDAFVVVNACTCSTILESLYFNRPIINDIEFKLVCGFEEVYGRVLWPSSDSHLSAEDLLNKRKVSDVSVALIHSRNELLERCSEARTNMWSGLEYRSSGGTDEKDLGVENLVIEDGLHGIASTYDSEPLEKAIDHRD